MAFPQAKGRTPTALGITEIVIRESGGSFTIVGDQRVIDEYGREMTEQRWKGDLDEHLSQGRLQQMQSTMNWLRDKFESEMLP